MIYQNLKNKNLIVFVNLGHFLLICQKIKFWHLDHFALPRLICCLPSIKKRTTESIKKKK